MVIIRNIEKILIDYMAELSKPTEDANYIPVSYVDEYNRRRKEFENKLLKINISKESDIFMKEPYISNINLECNILYHSDCNKEYVFRKTLKEPVHTDKINWDEVIKKMSSFIPK